MPYDLILMQCKTHSNFIPIKKSLIHEFVPSDHRPKRPVLYITGSFQQHMCRANIGLYPERLGGSGTGAMHIMLSAKFVCNATIVAWEMYRIRATLTGWVEVLRPVASGPGESYSVVHRTFVPAVPQDGLQKIVLGVGLQAVAGDVLAVRPADGYQFIDSNYGESHSNWPAWQCMLQHHLATDGSPSGISQCTQVNRKFALRAIVN